MVRRSTQRIVALLPVSVLILAAVLLGACSSPTGGSGGGGATELAIVEVYNPATNLWATLPDSAHMPTPRSTAVAVEVGGLIYVIGGSDWKVSGRPRYNTVEAFDPATNDWTPKASMSQRREAPAAVVLGGKIYVIGGASSSAVFHDSMEIYDPATNMWTAGPPMATARYGPVAGVVGGKIYVVGGLNTDKVDIATAEVFDPVGGAWATAVSMPTARGQAFAAVVNDTMYVIGGFSDSDSVTDANERFTGPSTWNSSPAAMPQKRGELDGGVYNGSIYVVGGIDQEGTSKDILAVLEVFDPSANGWTTLSVMPTARSEPAAAFAGGKLYVFGGYTAR